MTARPAATLTRTRLLDAAMRLIRTKGLSATRVEDVCAAAGVTKGGFFHHFPDKEAMTVAAAEHFGRMAEGHFASSGVRALATPRARLLAYVDLRRAMLAGEIADVTCLFGTVVQEVWNTHPGIRDAAERGISLHAATLVPDIEALRARHHPDADWTAESLALHVQAVLQGGFVLAKAKADVGVAVAVVDHLKRYLTALFPEEEEETP